MNKYLLKTLKEVATAAGTKPAYTTAWARGYEAARKAAAVDALSVNIVNPYNKFWYRLAYARGITYFNKLWYPAQPAPGNFPNTEFNFSSMSPKPAKQYRILNP